MPSGWSTSTSVLQGRKQMIVAAAAGSLNMAAWASDDLSMDHGFRIILKLRRHLGHVQNSYVGTACWGFSFTSGIGLHVRLRLNRVVRSP